MNDPAGGNDAASSCRSKRTAITAPRIAAPATAGAGGADDASHEDVTVRYGIAAFGDRFTATPEFGVSLSEGQRDYSLGWRLGLAPGGAGSLELRLDATRSEPANDAAGPEHAIDLRLNARF